MNYPHSLKISAGPFGDAPIDDVLRSRLSPPIIQKLESQGVKFNSYGKIISGSSDFVFAAWKIIASDAACQLVSLHDNHYKLKQEKSALDSKILQMQSQLLQSETKLKSFGMQEQILQQANRDILELKNALHLSKESEVAIKAENLQLKNECEQLKSEIAQLKNKLEKQKEDHVIEMQQKDNQHLHVVSMFKILEAKIDLIGTTNSTANSVVSSTTSSLEDS